MVKECRRGLQVERAWAWPNLRLVLKTTLTSVSGGPKHNAHRLCPVDAESVNMDREETHRLGLGPAGGESGHTRLLRQARGRSCAGWRGGEDHFCAVLLVMCVPKVMLRWVYLKQVTKYKKGPRQNKHTTKKYYIYPLI